MENYDSILYDREIVVWKKDEYTGKIYLAGSFSNMEKFFHKATVASSTYASYRFRGVTFEGFGSDFDERHDFGYYAFDHKRYFMIGENQCDKNRWLKSFYCYLCYDQFDKHYSRDRLVGLYRIWRDDRRKRYRRGWMSHGWKRGAWGGYKEPCITHELRWAEAWDDEEFAPKKGFARPRRRGRNLPNAWDDEISRSEKSWKTQSKRKHQWKPK